MRAWVLMGRQFDLAQLELVVELLGVQDIEGLIARLEAIRDWTETSHG